MKKLRKLGLLSVFATSLIIADVQAATTWNVSLWGARRAFTEHVEKLAELDFEKGLIVGTEANENVYLASRNIPGVYTVDVSGIDPVSLVAADKVILTVAAVEKIQEWLG